MNVITNPNSSIIQLGENLTFDHHTDFRTALQQALDAKGVIQFDCRALKYVDSAGLGMLLLTKTEAEKMNRGVKLLNVTGELLALFKLVHFDKHFNLTEADATDA